MRVKTNLWAKNQRVVSDKYRNGYDNIKWNDIKGEENDDDAHDKEIRKRD
jgi:hypothetical protein